jgi:LuxR family transcriptional regulator, maltose regulon positive regulatory protein
MPVEVPLDKDDRGDVLVSLQGAKICQAMGDGDRELAAGLIEGNYIRLIMDGQIPALQEWLEALPSELVRARPRLSLAYAWAMGYAGSGELLEKALRWVEAGLGDAPWLGDAGLPSWSRDAGDNALRGELLALRAIMVSRRYESCRAIEYAQEAIWLLWPGQPADLLLYQPADQTPLEELWLRVVLLIALGNAYRADGNARAAEPIYREAIRLSMGEGPQPIARFPMFALAAATRLGQTLVNRARLHEAEGVYRHALSRLEGLPEPVLFTGETHIRLGELLLEQDRLEQAASDIRLGLDLCLRSGDFTGQLAGYLALAQLECLMGNDDGACEAIDMADRLAGRDPGSYVRPLVAARRAQVELSSGDLPAAERWVRSIHEQRPKRRDFPRSVQEVEDQVLARVRLAQGRAADAECILGLALEAAESAGREGAAIQELALQALARSAEGDAGPALESLCRAVALGGPQGYARVFLDEGEPMRRLLEELAAHDRAGASQGSQPKPGCQAQVVIGLLDRFGVHA